MELADDFPEAGPQRVCLGFGVWVGVELGSLGHDYSIKTGETECKSGVVFMGYGGIPYKNE